MKVKSIRTSPPASRLQEDAADEAGQVRLLRAHFHLVDPHRGRQSRNLEPQRVHDPVVVSHRRARAQRVGHAPHVSSLADRRSGRRSRSARRSGGRCSSRSPAPAGTPCGASRASPAASGPSRSGTGPAPLGPPARAPERRRLPGRGRSRRARPPLRGTALRSAPSAGPPGPPEPAEAPQASPSRRGRWSGPGPPRAKRRALRRPEERRRAQRPPPRTAASLR